MSAILAHAHEACGERLVRAHDSDSTGWMLFRVRGDSQAEYVAVRRETGEVRFLGLLGVEARGASDRPLVVGSIPTRPTTAESCALKLGTLVLDGVVELPMRARAVVSFNYLKTPFTVGYLIKRYRYEGKGFYEKRLGCILQIHTKLRNRCAQDFSQSPPSTSTDVQPRTSDE